MCGWRGLIGSWYEINDKLRLSYVPFTFVTTCSLRYMHVRCPPAATTACLPRDTLDIHVSDTLYPVAPARLKSSGNEVTRVSLELVLPHVSMMRQSRGQ